MRNNSVILGLAAASALALSACATGTPATVSRYQAMPAPAGQTFAIVPMDASRTGTIQFNTYAAMVADGLRAKGYAPAANPQAATMLVKLGYGVDQGQIHYATDTFGDPWNYYGTPSAYGAPYWSNPYYSRWPTGPRTPYSSPYYMGWENPYMTPVTGYGAYGRFYQAARPVRVFTSFVDLDIRRAGDNAQLFEGHAKARSATDNLGQLVPNLVTAMFTNFPGKSGETVKITVPPPRKAG